MKHFMSAMLIILLTAASNSWAQVPEFINFQGKLSTLNLAPIDGAVDLKFLIYDTDAGGMPLWEENHDAVIVKSGLFNVLLGTGEPLAGDLFDALIGGNAWLEIAVVDIDGTLDVMAPRQRIGSVAYSFHSNTASTADDVPGKAINPGTVSISGYGQVIDQNGNWVGNPIAWDRLTDVPEGFSDGIDNVGIATEIDPQVGIIAVNAIPKWNGSELVTSSIREATEKVMVEKSIDISGGMKIGNTSACIDGTIRWTGTDFEGCKSGVWVSLTSGTGDKVNVPPTILGGITGNLRNVIISGI